MARRRRDASFGKRVATRVRRLTSLERRSRQLEVRRRRRTRGVSAVPPQYPSAASRRDQTRVIPMLSGLVRGLRLSSPLWRTPSHCCRNLGPPRPPLSADVRLTEDTVSPDVRDCPLMSPDAGGRHPASQAECRGFESHQPLQPKPLGHGGLGDLGRRAADRREGCAAA